MFCNDPSSFLDFTISDIANVIMAIINVILLFYIFIYQKQKDIQDHRTLVDQIQLSTKSDWFKLVILEPNVKTLHDYFSSIISTVKTVSPKNTPDEKIMIIRKIEEESNNFELKFLSLLGSVNQDLENSCIRVIDKLREDTIQNISSDNITDSNILVRLTTSKERDIISILYNFTPVVVS
jgi:hypothetical protein